MPKPYPSIVLGNYLKMVVRNFFRNKLYSVLNLFGLALGFGIFIFAAIYVYFETHFEDFHGKSDKIYRVAYRYAQESYQVEWARISFDYINQLPEDMTGVDHLIRFQNHERKYVRVGEEKFRPSHAYVTDKEVFDVFDFPLISGDAATALAEPYSVVITQTLATKYFGDGNPVGKEIYVIGDLAERETLHHITGVMKDLPANTHLPVEMLISFKDNATRSGWAYTYIKVDDNTSISQLEAQAPAFVQKYEDEAAAKRVSLIFQPLTDIHLHSNLAREIVPNGEIFYVKSVAFAGIFILIIAVINFMNLNSAMALGRAREIGMRKIMGATRGQLVSYLLTESVLLNILALTVGAGLVYLVFPLFQELVMIQFIPDAGWFGAMLVCVAVVCGLASGIYPVLLLTALRPMEVIKTSKALTFAKRESPFSLKRVMVTLQFCISIILLGSALIAYNQIQYLNEKNPGMKREAVIAIPAVPDKVTKGYPMFRNALSSVTGIKSVSACMEVPSREIRDSGPVLVENVNSDPTTAPVMDIQIIDNGMPELLGLEFLAGENIPAPLDPSVPEFTEEFTLQNYLMTRPRSYLINETAMRQLGWQMPEDAIGQRINWSIGDFVLPYGPIQGVVKDFHQETLKNNVDPLILVNEPVWLRTILIKVDTEDIQSAVAGIQATWDDHFPFYPMEYHFLDELYENLYKGERVQLQLLFVFSGLAIVIAFVGLIGLITYALKTRLKEIAVRKVLGATLGNLVGLMSREYVIVLLIGAVVAIPVSVYAVQQWLSEFAYHVDITPVSYALTVGLIVLLLVVTIGLQTLRTSQVNPADTLREE